ncbi:MAG TPA: hypothetical protein VKY65_16115 [Alphaproteobacteria bacterium]|nr:hypothetical protein [Alphaproteobacteria bacterium]
MNDPRVDLSSLIRDIEQAPEGDRELDIRIVLAAIPYPRRVGLWISLEFGAPARCDYTRSLDAALTLAPAGLAWEVSTAGGPRARIGAYEGRARTAPLALAAAALRARLDALESAGRQSSFHPAAIEPRAAESRAAR